MIDPQVKQALITSIEGLVQRLVAGSGLTPEQVGTIVSEYVDGRIADDTTASAGVSETELASVRGAYLAALKMLQDEFASSDEDLDTVAKVTAAIVDLRESVGDVETTLEGLTHAFVFRDEIQGGADDQNAFDLAALTEKSGGSYYKVTQSGWFVLEDGVGTPFEAFQGDGIIFKPDGSVFVDGNQTGTVEGTEDEIDVTGSVETGFVASLAQAVKDRLTALEDAVVNADKIQSGVDFNDSEFDDLFDPPSAAFLNALEFKTYFGTATPEARGVYFGDTGLTAPNASGRVEVRTSPGRITIVSFGRGPGTPTGSVRTTIWTRFISAAGIGMSDSGKARVSGSWNQANIDNGLQASVSELTARGGLMGTTFTDLLNPELTTVNERPLGFRQGHATLSSLGITGDAFTGDEIAAVQFNIARDGDLNRIIHIQAQYADYTWNKMIDGSVEDPESAGNATVTDWFSPRSEIEELIVALTDAFEEAAQPED